MAVQHKRLLDAVTLRNGEWGFNLAASVSAATIDMSVDQVTELNLVVDDPGYAILGNSRLPIGAPVDFQGAQLSVAVIETGAGGGQGGFEIACRPRIVRALKERRGAFTLKNVSPTQFVEAEVRAVGGTLFGQPSARRNQIARDVRQAGETGTDENSAWTTIQRLAGELGYLSFESNGVIYFGKPTWLVANNSRVNAFWDTNVAKRGYQHITEFPICRQSADDDNRTTCTLKLPLEQSADFRPGMGLNLNGMPRFGGLYLITSVNFPLVSVEQEMTVVAETPHDPTPTGTTT